jgi:hypothetical protein
MRIYIHTRDMTWGLCSWILEEIWCEACVQEDKTKIGLKKWFML